MEKLSMQDKELMILIKISEHIELIQSFTLNLEYSDFNNSQLHKSAF